MIQFAGIPQFDAEPHNLQCAMFGLFLLALLSNKARRTSLSRRDSLASYRLPALMPKPNSQPESLRWAVTRTRVAQITLRQRPGDVSTQLLCIAVEA